MPINFNTEPYHHPFGWLKEYNPGIAVLGNVGNFLGKLPDVLQNAIMLDIECLAGNTLITTANGDICTLESFSENQAILGADGDSKHRICSFVDGYNLVNKGKKHCYTIQSKYGLPITASDKHLFLTQSGWKYAKDLSTSDYLLVPKKTVDFSESNFTDQELALVGWFIAEGSRSVDNGSQKSTVSITVHELKHINWIKKNANPYVDHYYSSTDTKTWRLSVSKRGPIPGTNKEKYYFNKAKKLLSDLNLLDKYSWQKKIPDQLLTSSNRQLSIVLKCMFSGDGTVMKDRAGLSYTTTSKILAEQIVLVLSRFGILSSLSSLSDNRKDTFKDRYLVQITGEDAVLFYEKIGFIGRKQQELLLSINTYTKRQPKDRIPHQYTESIIKILRKAGLGPYKCKSLTGLSFHAQFYQHNSFTYNQIKKLIEVCSVPHLVNLLEPVLLEDFTWSKIQVIDDAGIHNVWDITTSTHEFIANNVVVHNTSGIGPKNIVFEAALYDLKNNRTIEYTLAPVRVLQEEGKKAAKHTVKYIESFRQLKKLSQPWSRERLKKGQFDYFKQYFKAVKENPAIIEQIKSTGQATIGNKTYLSPEAFFSQLSKDIKGTKGVYAANLQFENRQLSELYSTLPANLQKEIKEQFVSYSPKQPNFLYRTADIHPYTSAAFSQRSLTAWEAVGKAYSKYSMSGIRAGDILDIARSNMATANLSGFTKTKDLWTGTGVETLSQAFGLAEKELHTAAADAQLQGKLYNRLLQANTRLRSLRQGGFGGFITAFSGLLGGGSLSDIQAMQKIEAIQPDLKKTRLRQQLAHFELALRGKGVDKFVIKDHPVKSKVPQVVGNKTRWQEINYKTGPSVKKLMSQGATREEIIERFMRIAPEVLGTESYNINLAREMRNIASLEDSKLWKTYQPTASISAAERLAAKNLQTMNNARTWSRASMLQYLLTKYKGPMLGVGIVGAIVASKAINAISSDDDDYNTIEGLQEQGLAQQIRHALTPFGSGWRGLGESLRTFLRTWKNSPIFPTEGGGAIAKSIDKSISLYETALVGSVGAPKSIISSSLSKMRRLKESGIDVVGFVPVPTGTEESMAKFVGGVFHEFGHVLTMSKGGGLSPSGMQGLYMGMIENKRLLVGLRNKMMGEVENVYSKELLKSGKGQIKAEHVLQITESEMAAESISHYLQRESGVASAHIDIARGYYPGGRISPLDLLSTTQLGETMMEHQTVLSRLSNISGKDDIYNTIEGLSHKGLASALRKIFTDFGSGWRGIFSKVAGFFSKSARLKQARSALPSDIRDLTFFGSSKLAKALGQRIEAGGTYTAGKIESLLEGRILSKSVKSELGRLNTHISKLHSTGYRNIPIVFNRRSYGASDLISTAYHEYGHAVTLEGVGYTKSAAEIYKKYMLSKDTGFREFRDLMIEPVKQFGGNVSSEMMAESVSLYRQRMAGIKKPTLAKAYFSGKPGQEGLESMSNFGRDLVQGRIAGTDDPYNTIEALRHGGMAEQMRREIDVKFGSGWTRDVSWTLPYQLSLTQQRSSAYHIDRAYELTRNMIQTTFTPPGLWAAGTSVNVYNSSLPFSTPDTRSNIRNRYETHGLSPRLAGFSEQGMAATYRSWNTGFGSGWKGAISVRDAAIDFGGYRKPNIQPDYSGSLEYYNNDGYDFPRVEVAYQSVSPTRYLVDSISAEMTEQMTNRRVKDYYRKVQMSENQISTSMKMFSDAQTGGKRHARG